MRLFITGGAGFIGSRLVKRLAETPSHQIYILDSLLEQVHGPAAKFPNFPDNVTCTKGSIQDKVLVEKIIKDFKPTHVFHLAAETGTSQSMDEIQRYCEVNVQGTAILIEILLKHGSDLKQFVLASSRAVYGEGPWEHPLSKLPVVPQPRNQEQIDQKRYNPFLATGMQVITPLPVTEDTAPTPSSIYASTKLMQEYLALQSNLKSRSLIFRFQNVYGAGQSLRNPYTGVLSIFTARLLKKQNIDIFEDGNIVRDFIHVDDVVEGLMRSFELGITGGEIINLGSGVPTTIQTAAETIAKKLDLPLNCIRTTGGFRLGDIRYACANIERAKQRLGWQPKVDLKMGISGLVDWSKDELSQRS